MTRPEVKERLAPVVRELARSYGLRAKWVGNVCYFDGPARGYLKVMDGSVLLLANLSAAALLFKTSIEQGTIERLDSALN